MLALWLLLLASLSSGCAVWLALCAREETRDLESRLAYLEHKADRWEAAIDFWRDVAETRALEACYPGRRFLPVDSTCTVCGRFHRFEPCEHCDGV